MIKEKKLQLLRKNVELVRVNGENDEKTLNPLRISQFPSRYVYGGIRDTHPNLTLNYPILFVVLYPTDKIKKELYL